VVRETNRKIRKAIEKTERERGKEEEGGVEDGRMRSVEKRRRK